MYFLNRADVTHRLLYLGKIILPVLCYLSFAKTWSGESERCSVLFAATRSFDFQISPPSVGLRIYSHGHRTARAIWRMKAAEYERAANEELIPPDVILLLDRLPLHIDLPAVQGVFVSTPLSSEGSHIQVQAEVMQIPLLFSKDFFDDAKLAKLAESQTPVEVSTSANFLVKEIKKGFLSPQNSQIAVVLPTKMDRQEKKIYSISNYRGQRLELVGSKFKPLADLAASELSDLIPQVFALSPGYFEDFLDHAKFQNLSLREWRSKTLTVITQSTDQDQVRSSLLQLRNAIQKADAPFFFESLAEEIKRLNIDSRKPLSLRSNNEIEDLIGSGVFSSSIAREVTAGELSRALKNVWAAMYTLRSYEIRRAQNAIESNLSMPILFHEYLANEKLNATARIVWTGNSFQVKFNGVIGSQSRATNPDEKSTPFSLEIRERNGIPFIAKTHDANSPLGKVESQQLMNLFRMLRPKLLEDFASSDSKPIGIDLEILLDATLQPKILQYKKRLSRETLVGLMSGHLDLEILNRALTTTTADEASILHLMELNQVRFLNTQETHPNPISFEKTFCRFAVVRVHDKYRLIIWVGFTHAQYRQWLTKKIKKIKWITTGYIDRNKDGSIVLSSESYPSRLSRIEYYRFEIESALIEEAKLQPGYFQRIPGFIVETHEEKEAFSLRTPLADSVPEAPSMARRIFKWLWY